MTSTKILFTALIATLALPQCAMAETELPKETPLTKSGLKEGINNTQLSLEDAAKISKILAEARMKAVAPGDPNVSQPQPQPQAAPAQQSQINPPFVERGHKTDDDDGDLSQIIEQVGNRSITAEQGVSRIEQITNNIIQKEENKLRFQREKKYSKIRDAVNNLAAGKLSIEDAELDIKELIEALSGKSGGENTRREIVRMKKAIKMLAKRIDDREQGGNASANSAPVTNATPAALAPAPVAQEQVQSQTIPSQ